MNGKCWCCKNCHEELFGEQQLCKICSNAVKFLNKNGITKETHPRDFYDIVYEFHTDIIGDVSLDGHVILKSDLNINEAYGLCVKKIPVKDTP